MPSDLKGPAALVQPKDAPLASAAGARAAQRTEEAPRWHTDALLVVMALLWGINFSVLKFATAYISPLALNGVRVTIAMCAQMGYAQLRGATKPNARDARALIWWGMLGNGVYQALFISGLFRARVATAALLIAASPAFIAILGRLRRTEFITGRQWVGVVAQLAGCASVALGATRGGGNSADSPLGVLLILTACLTWAFYAVGVKKYSEYVEPWYLGGYTMIGGAIVMGALGFSGIVSTPWRSLDGRVWLALLYSSLGAMVFAYLFYYRGLKVLGPTRTSMYSNLQPLIAMVVAWALLREQPTGAQSLGALLIIGGLLVTRSAAEPAEA